MRVLAPAVPRRAIDAEIGQATYPGHEPARWALPLLDELEALAAGWQLVQLDEAALGSLWLPAHAGEACHGDSMVLGGNAGATVADAAAWLGAHAEAYAAANRSCWGRITRASGEIASRIVVSPVGVGDRVKPADAALVVIDGYHRALGGWMAGRRTCIAYVPLLTARSVEP